MAIPFNPKKLYPLLIIGIVFLFFGNANYIDFRIFESVWNLGHIALAFITTLIVIDKWNYFNNKTYLVQISFIIVLSFFVGVGVELLQTLFDRDSSWIDVYLDVLGALTAVVFFSNKAIIKNSVFKWFRNTLMLVLFIFALIPIISDSSDEIIQLYQLPIISNFETPFESRRWDARKKSVSTEQARHGEFSLKVKVAERKFQGASLEHFYSNWSKYQFFHISIFNTLNTQFKFEVKIYDQIHTKNPKDYNDRFNREYSLKPGWNDIKISIEDIKKSPKTRVLDLTKIRKVSVFPLEKRKSFYIYIDNLYLN